MKIPDLKKAIDGIDFKDEKDGKTLKDKLGEIKDDNSLNEFYEEWKKFLKKTYLSLHPDKNPGKEADFKDFREKAGLINEYIDIFTKNDNVKREFKDSHNQDAFLQSTRAINSSESTNIDSSRNKNSSQSKEGSSPRTQNSSDKFKSFEDLCSDIDWSNFLKPDPQKKASWFASVDELGKLVVVNSNGEKDLNSKILEKTMFLISCNNPNPKDRFEVESKTISGVILIVSNDEMKKIAPTNNEKKDNKITYREEIKIPPDLDECSCRKMTGIYDEKAFANTASAPSITGSYASKYPSNKGLNNRPANTNSSNVNTGR